MPKPEKGSRHLRTGRASTPGAVYFITVCSHGRQTGLAQPALFAALQAELSALQIEGVMIIRAYVLMPDHLHLLLALGELLDLSKAIARLKSKLTPRLKQAGLAWQSGFHDHRLRAEESLAPYFRYIHLNPYEARLLGTGMLYPYTWFRAEDWEWFESMTDDGKALPEWLAGLP